MARNRVDDEEALIPRSDQEEFHPTARKKRGRCCGMKVCFFLFFLLVLGTIIVFYFVYPSYVTGAVDTFLGYFKCDGDVNYPIACVVAIATPTVASVAPIRDTWGTQCKELVFIYKSDTKIDDPTLKNQSYLKAVDDVNSLAYLADERLSNLWVLKVDASTYVSRAKIQTFLSKFDDLDAPRYVASVSDDGNLVVGVPYLVSATAVTILRNETLSAKDKTLKEVDVTEKKLNTLGISAVKTTFAADVSNGKAEEMLTKVKAPVYYGLTPEQMYMTYLISGDSAR